MDQKKLITIYEPDINLYSSSAIKAIQSGWISNHGIFIDKAKEKLAVILKCKYVILMSNGTCATHCLFLSVKFKYPHVKKIYVPNNSYIAAWNSALMVYNIDQIEVMKMNLDTWNIETDEEYIKSLDTNSVVLIVHNLGNIINVPRLKKIRPDLIFVEDNCEGLFGKYNEIFSGTSQDTLCSSISFYGNKVVTTGEGGAFITHHKDIYEYINKVYSQGMSNTRYLHDVHAYNYRMTNVQAAFLYDQLSDIENILANKKKIFENYERLLDPLINKGKITLFKKEHNTENADWIFAVRIIGNNKSIEETNEFFKNNNVDIRPFFYPINKHGHLMSIKNDDEVSELLNKEVIMIPSSPTITSEEQTYVVDIISLFIKTTQEIYIRDVLKNNAFDLIDKTVIFNLDNKYYDIIRNNVNKLISETISNYNNKIILEIGPKNNINERIYSKNNIIETVDIVNDNNTTYVADLTQENCIPKEYFDVVYCLEVLEHTYEPWEILKNIYKLLKNDGYLHLSIPFQFRMHGPLPDCYRISEYGIKYLLEKYNFKIIKFEAVIDNSRPAFPIHYTITCIKYKI
jgi:perosamine synthetase